jgi:hypothetical protein
MFFPRRLFDHSKGALVLTWFLKYYSHDECNTHWTDEWSCACNDSCPECGSEIEPYRWDDLSVVLSHGTDGSGWTVAVSAIEAEDDPEYTESYFETRQDAEDFAREESERLNRIWESPIAQ